MSEPKSMHTRVHIVTGGHGDGRGDWVTSLCGRTLPMKDYFMAWVLSDVGAHCKTCLAEWEKRSRGMAQER
jgi:hypothetical protein